MYKDTHNLALILASSVLILVKIGCTNIGIDPNHLENEADLKHGRYEGEGGAVDVISWEEKRIFPVTSGPSGYKMEYQLLFTNMKSTLLTALL